MPAILNYPNINGVYPDWARIGVSVLPGTLVGVPKKGFRAIKYSDRSNGELAMHNSQLPAGQTSGQMMPDKGSITMLLPEYNIFRQGITSAVSTNVSDAILSGIISGFTNGHVGAGAYTRMWNLAIKYGGVGQNGLPYTICDVLLGCRMDGTDQAHRSSGGALETTFSFQPTVIAYGGVLPNDVADLADLQNAIVNLLNTIG